MYWTEEDQKFLMENYSPNSKDKQGNKWIAKKLGRTPKSVRVKYNTLKKRGFAATVLPRQQEGVVKGSWSAEEQEFLIKHYCYGCPKGANNWIAEKLGRSSKSLSYKYYKLRKRGFVLTDGARKEMPITSLCKKIAPAGRTKFYAFDMR